VVAPASATFPGTNGEILFSGTGIGMGQQNLVLMGADGSNQRQITSSRARNGRWSPDGLRVLRSTSGWETTLVDGTDAVPLSALSAIDSAEVSYSPDGQRFIYQTWFAGTGGEGRHAIFEQNVDGTNLRSLPRFDGTPGVGNSGQGGGAVWSPDCSRIAWWSPARAGLSYATGSSEIFVSLADGSQVRQLTSDPETDYRPDWSPDGTKLAWISGRSGANHIWEMNADGSAQVEMPNQTPGRHVDAVRYSPDGTKFVMSTNRTTGNSTYDIQTSNIDGTGFQRLTSPTIGVGIGGDFDPWWQPVGRSPAQCPMPVASIAAAAGLAGQSIVLDGSGSSYDAGTLSYTWNFGDGQSGSGQSPSHTYAHSGEYTARLTVEDRVGRSGTTSRSVQVSNNPPSARFAVPSAAYRVAGKSIRFDAAGSGDVDGSIVSYRWSFDDGTTAQGLTSLHTFAAPGRHSVELTVTDNEGAVATQTQQVEIGVDPPLSVSITSDTPRRALGTELQFVGTASDANGTIAAYAWDFGDGGSAATASATHRYQAAGTYSVRLTATDDDGNRNSAAVNVDVAPGWTLRATEPDDDAIFSSTPPRLAWDSSGGDGTGYYGVILAATSAVPSGGQNLAGETWSAETLFAGGPQSIPLKNLQPGTYFWTVQATRGASPGRARKFTVGPDLKVAAKSAVGETRFALSTVRLKRAQLTVPSDRAQRIKQSAFDFETPESRYGQAEATYTWKCGNPGTHEARLSGKNVSGKTYTAKTSFKTPSCAHRYKASLTKGRRKITTKQEAGFQLIDRWKHSGERYQVCVYGPKTKCFTRHTRASGTNVFYTSGLPAGSYRAVWRSQGRVAGTWRFRVKAPYVAPPSPPSGGGGGGDGGGGGGGGGSFPAPVVLLRSNYNDCYGRLGSCFPWTYWYEYVCPSVYYGHRIQNAGSNTSRSWFLAGLPVPRPQCYW
jgi:PKD repeat protein